MSLKNVKRVTFSLPKIVIEKLEIVIPKSQRSKYIADLLKKNLPNDHSTTFEEEKAYWSHLAQRTPRKTNKTAVELIREDRKSH